MEILSQSFSWLNLLIQIIVAALVLGVLLFFVMYALYFERKVLGWIQVRNGPNRVGYKGLLQSPADVLKLLLKEDITPKKADRFLF